LAASSIRELSFGELKGGGGSRNEWLSEEVMAAAEKEELGATKYEAAVLNDGKNEVVLLMTLKASLCWSFYNSAVFIIKLYLGLLLCGKGVCPGSPDLNSEASMKAASGLAQLDISGAAKEDERSATEATLWLQQSAASRRTGSPSSFLKSPRLKEA
jgi:hypothetical protein